MPNSHNKSAQMAAIAIVIAAAALLLLLSPLVLLLLDALFEVDWARLSEIAQSYTGVSAFLSGIALVGVAVSLRLQARQTDLLQGQASRQFQFELLQLSMADPVYASLFVPATTDGDHNSFRRHLYQSQYFRYLEFEFQAGGVSTEGLENTLTTQIFPVSESRRWWEQVRTDWTIAARNSRGSSLKTFVEIVDHAYRRSLPQSGAAGST